MADYDCWPLWSKAPDEPENLDPKRLLSDELSADLMHWAQKYDDTLNRADPRASGFSDELAHTAFVEEGWLLAKRVDLELRDQFCVYYFDDMQQRLISVSIDG